VNIAIGWPSLERATLNDSASPNQEPSAAPAAEPASTAPATSTAPAASQSGQSEVSSSSSEAKKGAYVAPAPLPTQEGPRGLRFDYNEGCRIAAPEGDVFVANAGNHTVEEFSSAGAFLRKMSSGISEPESVAIGDANNGATDTLTIELYASGRQLPHHRDRRESRHAGPGESYRRITL
jgi:hypothetical protein